MYFRSDCNLEVLVLVEGWNPEKNPRSKDENQQQTQPTYDAGSENQTRATLVEGKPPYHYANSALQEAKVLPSEKKRHPKRSRSQAVILQNQQNSTFVTAIREGTEPYNLVFVCPCIVPIAAYDLVQFRAPRNFHHQIIS